MTKSPQTPHASPLSPAMPPRAVTVAVRFGRAARAQRAELARASRQASPPRVPHAARLVALALRLEGLLRSGAVSSQRELADISHVTTARVAQIMNLLHLAPDIIEEILHLPAVEQGRDPVSEHQLRAVVRHVDWRDQRREWRKLMHGSRKEL